MHRDIEPRPSYDAFWIFALWRALHGGDPTLADIAAAVIANLSQYLPANEESFGVAPLPASPHLQSTPELEEQAEESNNIEEKTESEHAPSQSCGDSRSSDLLCTDLFCTDLFCIDPCDFSIHHNYFEFKGVFYRIDRPASACSPTAA